MTRNGKIARLPHDIREELNERILNGQTAAQLLDWLHKQDEVWEVLEEHDFDPVNDQNLSDWKAGGYRCWLENREAREMVMELAMKSQELGEVSPEEYLGVCVGNLLMVELIKMVKVLVQREEDPEKRMKQLREVNLELTRLRWANARDVRAGIQQKRCGWEEEDREEVQAEKHAEWVKKQRLAEYRLRPAVAAMASGHEKKNYEAAWCLAAREVEIANDLPKGLLDRVHVGGYWLWEEDDEQWHWWRRDERAGGKRGETVEGRETRGEAEGKEDGESKMEDGDGKAPKSKHQSRGDGTQKQVPEKRQKPSAKKAKGKAVEGRETRGEGQGDIADCQMPIANLKKGSAVTDVGGEAGGKEDGGLKMEDGEGQEGEESEDFGRDAQNDPRDAGATRQQIEGVGDKVENGSAVGKAMDTPIQGDSSQFKAVEGGYGKAKG